MTIQKPNITFNFYYLLWVFILFFSNDDDDDDAMAYKMKYNPLYIFYQNGFCSKYDMKKLKRCIASCFFIFLFLEGGWGLGGNKC